MLQTNIENLRTSIYLKDPNNSSRRFSLSPSRIEKAAGPAFASTSVPETMRNPSSAVRFPHRESEEQVLEYFGGPPASAKTIVKNGDPEERLGISVPGETVRTGSLMKAFVQIGVLVRELNLQVIDFGQGSCLVSLFMPTRI
jgi:hypothetical protein